MAMIARMDLGFAAASQPQIVWNRPTITRQELVSVLNCLIEDEIGPGKLSNQFEREVGKALGFRHCLAVNSATAAYHLVFLALGLQPGDAIVCSSLAPLEVFDAASYVGAKIIPLDLERGRFHPSVAAFRAVQDPAVKVWLADHRFGSYNPHLAELKAAAAEVTATNSGRPPVLLEDISDILGKEVDGDYVGHSGKLAIAALTVDKMLTIGQGALIFGSDPRLHGQLTDMRDGERPLGAVRYDYRIGDLQAAIGMEQLSHLATILERRKTLATHLLRILPRTRSESWFVDPERDAYLHFPIVAPVNQEQLERHFKSLKIETRRVHERPLHQHLNLNRLEFPNAEKLWMRGTLLPFYPAITKAGVTRLETAVRALM